MPNGEAVTTLSLATSERWKDKNSGEMKEMTEWHRITFYGELAEIAGEYLKKGMQIYLEGKIRTRKRQDKSGQDRYTTEIIADQMQMLGRKESGAANDGGDSQSYNHSDRQTQKRPVSDRSDSPSGAGDMEDDIPFYLLLLASSLLLLFFLFLLLLLFVFPLLLWHFPLLLFLLMIF